MYKIRDYKEIKNRNEKIKKIISIFIYIIITWKRGDIYEKTILK